MRRGHRSHTLATIRQAGRPFIGKARMARHEMIAEEDHSMRRATIIAACFTALLVSVAAAPAFAGYGAVAFDEKSAKYGFGWNEDTQKRANEAAIQACNSEACKVVIPVPPRRCAAFATGEKGNAWGGGVDAARDKAKLRAIENCQKNTSGKCVLRGSDCNR
ncbi:MAG TPA: DUF4189 domain-containing protein [Stellaceae bacterium]